MPSYGGSTNKAEDASRQPLLTFDIRGAKNQTSPARTPVKTAGGVLGLPTATGKDKGVANTGLFTQGKLWLVASLFFTFGFIALQYGEVTGRGGSEIRAQLLSLTKPYPPPLPPSPPPSPLTTI